MEEGMLLIDCLLIRRHTISKAANCKVMPIECHCTTSYPVMDLYVKPKDKRIKRHQRRIRWWLLDECTSAESESTQNIWDKIEVAVLGSAGAVLVCLNVDASVTGKFGGRTIQSRGRLT